MFADLMAARRGCSFPAIPSWKNPAKNRIKIPWTRFLWNWWEIHRFPRGRSHLVRGTKSTSMSLDAPEVSQKKGAGNNLCFQERNWTGFFQEKHEEKRRWDRLRSNTTTTWSGVGKDFPLIIPGLVKCFHPQGFAAFPGVFNPWNLLFSSFSIDISISIPIPATSVNPKCFVDVAPFPWNSAQKLSKPLSPPWVCHSNFPLCFGSPTGSFPLFKVCRNFFTFRGSLNISFSGGFEWKTFPSF